MKIQFAAIAISTLLIAGCAGRRHHVKVAMSPLPAWADTPVEPPAPPLVKGPQPDAPPPQTAPAPVPQENPDDPLPPSPRNRTHRKMADPAPAPEAPDPDTEPAARPETGNPAPAPPGIGFPERLLMAAPLVAAALWLLARKAGKP